MSTGAQVIVAELERAGVEVAFGLVKELEAHGTWLGGASAILGSERDGLELHEDSCP